MSVLVKGMKMPENCIRCPMQFGGWCYVTPAEIDERVASTTDEALEQGKPDWCPLVEVPTPHGRLIDHKKLEKDLGERWNVNDDQDFCNKEVWHALESAPTVIAEEFPDWCFEDCDCLDGECPYYVKDGCRLAGDSE